MYHVGSIAVREIAGLIVDCHRRSGSDSAVAYIFLSKYRPGGGGCTTQQSSNDGALPTRSKPCRQLHTEGVPRTGGMGCISRGTSRWQGLLTKRVIVPKGDPVS
jgi:hypothetical protein